MLKTLQFAMVSLLFFAANAVAAAVMYLLVFIAREFTADSALVFSVIGLAGIAAALVFLWFVTSQLPKWLARGRA